MKIVFAFILLFLSLQGTGQILEKQIQDIKPRDEKRGNVLGTIYTQTGFSDLDTFALSGAVTPTISNSKILLDDGTGSGSTITLKKYTALDRWTLKAGFVIGAKTSVSYAFNIGISTSNSTFPLSFYGSMNHRSTVGYDGVLDLKEFNGSITTTVASSISKVSFSAGDSIEIILDRNVNVFTFIARNVTTATAEVSVSYTYTGFTTAVNTGRPFAGAAGSDSVYHFSFYSDESLNADLITIGDSKFTWYGNHIAQSIPSLMYAKYGNIVNHSKSGDKTAEVILTTDEVTALNPRKALVTVGSNDIRNGVSSGTWQANIDSIYNRFTRAGIDVYFDLMYETDVSQSTLITYLSAAYPTKYIGAGYAATRDCKSCLLADDIHMTAYGNKKWVEAVAQSGMIDFFNPFREMKFTAGDVGFMDVGDSLIINEYFRTTNKINVFRDGEMQWEASSYEPYSITRSNDSLIFHPPVSTGERIVIQTYNRVQWATIPGEPPPTSYLLTDYPNAEVAYSVRKLRAAYLGECLRVRRSSDNTEQDIGFVNNELDTAALKIFVGANSAYVTKWYNQANADAGSDAAQSTSGNQPRIMNSGVIDRVQNNNGDWIVSVLFDGSNDYLQFSDESAAYGIDWSSFMVQKRTAGGELGGFISNDACCIATPYLKTDDNIEILTVGSNAHPYYNRSADATATYCLLSGFNISAITSAYKNGTGYSMGGDTDYGFTGNAIINTIGRLNTSYSHAYISEAVFYKNDKSASRSLIETNINTFFNLY